MASTICYPSIAGDESTKSKKKIVKAAIKLLKQILKAAKGKKPSKVEAMKENHNTTAADGELQLPEEIIHHIQSFMWDRCCARTALLSKSWYNAWSTRPTLKLSHYDFLDLGGSDDGFPEFAKKTMQRYQDLNLRIHTLWLRMDYNNPLAKELIVKAIRLGAIHLRIENTTSPRFLLPDVVLKSQTLASLYVCSITVDLDKRKKEVNFPKLKSLTLRFVEVKGDLFRDLISRCPTIEELTLYHVYRSTDDGYRYPNWNDVRICSPSLERLSIRLPYFSTTLDAEFDVPNIRRFEFKGSPSSRLDFKTTTVCREWESDVCMKYYPSRQSSSWFSSLNKFVKMLSPSRVSLSIDVVYIDRTYTSTMLDNNPRHVGDDLPIPLVENLNLKVQGDEVTPAFLDSLCWSCRPKFVRIIHNRPKLFQQLRWKNKTFSTEEDIAGCFKF